MSAFIGAPAATPARKRGKSDVVADANEKRLLRAYRFMPAEARALMLRVAESYEKEPRHKAPVLRIVSAVVVAT